jgi:pimeloyl-ACP methyl ester carboxylesterase
MSTWTAADGTQINFEVHGDENIRDKILLLPGLLGSLNTQWQRFIPPLAIDFQVVIMDLRGHGRSTNQDSSLIPEHMAEDIAGLLDHLAIRKVGIAGYDLGGYLGLVLAINEPNRVTSLLMHGTKFYWSSEAAAAMREQLDPDSLASRLPAFADQLVQIHGGRHWRTLTRQAADLVGLLAQEGLTEGDASRTKCPVLVSVGDRDEVVPLPEALRLSQVLPEGRLLVLPGVRHAFQTVNLVPMLPMMQLFHGTTDR